MSPALMGAENAFLGNVTIGRLSELRIALLGSWQSPWLELPLVMLSYSSRLCSHRPTELEGPNFVCMLSRAGTWPGLSLVFLCAHRLKQDSNWFITVSINSSY